MRSVAAAPWRQYLVVVALSGQGAVLTGLVPPLLEAWGYSVAAIGLLVALSWVVALVSRLPGGLLYASARARWLLLGALLASIVASVLHPLATTLPAIVAARALVGLSHGIATTVNLAVFAEVVPPGRARQHALGYYMAGVAVGYSLGAFLTGVVADWVGPASAFLLAAAFGAIALLGVPLHAIAPHAAARPEEPFRLRALGHPRVVAVVVVTFSLFSTFAFWNAYLPLYGLAVGLTLGEVGAIRGAFGLCQVVARPASGAAIGRLGVGRMTLIGLLTQTGLLMLVPLLDRLPPLLVLFVVMGTARALAVVANAVELVEGAEAAGLPRGVMSGVYNTASDLAFLAGPALGGLLASVVGVPGSFVALPALTLAACAAALLAARPRPAIPSPPGRGLG